LGRWGRHTAYDASLKDDADSAGRRGLGATVLVEKFAGDAAERGEDLETIVALARRVNDRASTFSVGLTSCTPSQRGPIYVLREDEMDLGIGISGSPGRERAPLATAREIAAILLDEVLEGLVLGQVRRLLVSPELMARTITAVQREKGAAEDTQLEEGEVIEALGALEPVWEELYSAEQARILRLLIERIDVAPDGIPVTLHAAGGSPAGRGRAGAVAGQRTRVQVSRNGTIRFGTAAFWSAGGKCSSTPQCSSDEVALQMSRCDRKLTTRFLATMA
jgi:hypothetical protein